MRMATGWPSIFSCACVEICCCICAAALSAASALGKVAMTSSPMVLITVPWRCSVALRITSMQIDHIARPQVAHGVVEPCRAHDIGKQDRQLYVFAHARSDYTKVLSDRYRVG